MTPTCPACDGPMQKQGRTFLCQPCRQIMIFFKVSQVDEPSKFVVDALADFTIDDLRQLVADIEERLRMLASRAGAA